jgi:hypothetical protein
LATTGVSFFSLLCAFSAERVYFFDHDRFALICRSSAAGAALLFTIDDHTPLSKLIGYQILFGVGVGPVMQSYGIALMADVPSRKLIPQAMAVSSFFQRVGGTLGVAM